MKRLKRLICRIFGHKETELAIIDRQGLVGYCPRCLAVHFGEGHLRGKR